VTYSGSAPALVAGYLLGTFAASVSAPATGSLLNELFPTAVRASVAGWSLAAGVLDELTLDIAPVLLGSGERLFDGVESLGFEPVEVLHSPLATHIRYQRAR